MKEDYDVPEGWLLNPQLSDSTQTCITCCRCGMNQARNDGHLDQLAESAMQHVCALPTTLDKMLYFHDVPQPWPYASKGQHPADVPSLATWVLALPATFRAELIELILTGKAAAE